MNSPVATVRKSWVWQGFAALAVLWCLVLTWQDFDAERRWWLTRAIDAAWFWLIRLVN